MMLTAGGLSLLSIVNRDILSLARQAGFDELESDDIEDVLASHREELTNEDLQQLTEHSPVDDEEEPQQTLTTKRLAEAFNLIQQGMQILVDDDKNRERS
ncbi:putative Tigger transposable element-derived protein 1-like 229 [Homarus americanus]|uniref:Putative Tigger transposable element-derived protein 1-like 229 n=1 Tax=Homarus americanus TaxID=6706 RepID=A0A8J5MV69_HOMAM|nr:putative Tigger transposable element-derived protein 1-like 229 [Homarus americanus]